MKPLSAIILLCFFGASCASHVENPKLPALDETPIEKVHTFLFTQFEELYTLTVRDLTVHELLAGVRKITPAVYCCTSYDSTTGIQEDLYALSASKRGSLSYGLKIATRPPRGSLVEDPESLKVLGFGLVVDTPDGVRFFDPIVPYFWPYEKRANQSPEPTAPSVTPRACARVAPASTVAHL